jgi:hypothetical protein
MHNLSTSSRPPRRDPYAAASRLKGTVQRLHITPLPVVMGPGSEAGTTYVFCVRFNFKQPGSQTSSFRDGALAPDPESRDSGFDALHRPGMTASLRDLAACFRARFALERFARPKEGVGNAGRPMHPRPGGQKKQATPAVVTTGSPELPGIPAREWFYGFLRALPGDQDFLTPSLADCVRQLDTDLEASGPHDFAVRLSCLRLRHPRRPPHPAPRP